MQQALQSLLVAACALLLSIALAITPGCASSGAASVAKAGNEPILVRFTAYQTGHIMGIVNDAWLQAESYEGETPSERRTAFYSRKTAEAGAGIKVASDAEVAATLEVFEEYRFSSYSQQGSPPSDLSQSIEVQRPGSHVYVYGKRGMDLDQGQAFRDTVTAFVAIFNALDQYQAVEGGVEFSQPDPRQ